MHPNWHDGVWPALVVIHVLNIANITQNKTKKHGGGKHQHLKT